MKTSSQNNKNDAFAVFFGEVQEDTPSSIAPKQTPAAEWDELTEPEGKLAVDIFETEKKIFVYSTMAGALADKIEVYVHDDVLTIRGQRPAPRTEDTKTSYVHKECYWGSFSRTVVLPVDVKGELAKAEYKNGLLMIEIPKREQDRKVPIRIVEE